jgi:hypothetical protein
MSKEIPVMLLEMFCECFTWPILNVQGTLTSGEVKSQHSWSDSDIFFGRGNFKNLFWVEAIFSHILPTHDFFLNTIILKETENLVDFNHRVNHYPFHLPIIRIFIVIDQILYFIGFLNLFSS